MSERTFRMRGLASKERDKTLHEALTMSTENRHILALRREIEWLREGSRFWENECKEWQAMYEELEREVKCND